MSDDVKWWRKLWPGDRIQKKVPGLVATIGSISCRGVNTTGGTEIPWHEMQEWEPYVPSEPKIPFPDLRGWNAIVEDGRVVALVDPAQQDDGRQPVKVRDEVPVSELLPREESTPLLAGGFNENALALGAKAKVNVVPYSPSALIGNEDFPDPAPKPETDIPFPDLTGWVCGLISPSDETTPVSELGPPEKTQHGMTTGFQSVFGSAKLKDITSGEKNTPIGSDAPDRFEPTEAWLKLYAEVKTFFEFNDSREYPYLLAAFKEVFYERHKAAADHV